MGVKLLGTSVLVLSCLGRELQADTEAEEKAKQWLLRQDVSKSPSLSALILWAAGSNDRLEAAVEQEPEFPSYTWALTILAGRSTPQRCSQLKEAQLCEGRGFLSENRQYGGWDLGGARAKATWIRCDLSVTTFVVEALSLSKVSFNRDAALIYLDRCRDRKSGGYFFCPWASKAGFRQDGTPRPYGSMTSDAVRALLACGVDPEDPKIARALQWLRNHFTLDRNPGFEESDEEERIYADATLYYYYQSLARTIAKVPPDPSWSRRLEQQILSHQRPDGSWINPKGNEYTREHEPVVATCYALVALRACHGK